MRNQIKSQSCKIKEFPEGEVTLTDINKKGVEVHDTDWKELRKMREDSELNKISRFSGRVLEEFAQGNLVHTSKLDEDAINGYEPSGDLIEPRQED